MRFALDYDETIVKGDLVPLACERVLANGGYLSRIYQESDIGDWELSNFPEILRQEIFRMFADPFHAVWNKRFIEGVYYFMYTLRSMGHEVHIVTCRPTPTHDATKAFTERYLPWINGLHMVNHESDIGGSKTDVLRDLRPDVFFDDAPIYVKEAIDLGIEAYMVSNKRTAWNHNFRYPGLRKIKNPAYFPIERLWEDS